MVAPFLLSFWCFIWDKLISISIFVPLSSFPIFIYDGDVVVRRDSC